MSTDSSSQGAISQWADLGRAQADMVRAVGEYQDRVSHAHAVDVASGGDATVTAMKQIDLHALKVFYQQLLRSRNDYFRKRREIDAKLKAVQRLYAWERIWPDAISGAWVGWQYFYQQATPECHRILAGIKVYPTARLASNYIWPRNPLVSPDACPGSARNAEGLIGWLRLKHYMPRAGSDAAGVVEEALDAVGQVAGQKLAELKQWAQEMQDGTFKTFDPMRIADLKTNQALGDQKP